MGLHLHRNHLLWWFFADAIAACATATRAGAGAGVGAGAGGAGAGAGAGSSAPTSAVERVTWLYSLLCGEVVPTISLNSVLARLPKSESVSASIPEKKQRGGTLSSTPSSPPLPTTSWATVLAGKSLPVLSEATSFCCVACIAAT